VNGNRSGPDRNQNEGRETLSHLLTIR
jgi:hypothetical protein